MPVNVDRFALELANDLLECFCVALADTTGGSPCECCLSAGDAPADYCCDCGQGNGQAWVRVVEIFASSDVFPNRESQVARCRTGSYGVILELGTWRCAAIGDPDPPTCTDKTRDTEILLDDAAAARRAIDCCFITPGRDVVAGSWRSRGPMGGCVGGVTQVTVQAYDCC